jgi:cytidine deaminase
MDPTLEKFCDRTHVSAAELSQQLDPRRIVSRKEQLQRLNSALDPLYWQAERARNLGISWRNFCVGCAVWAFRADASTHEDRWRVFYGMNTKVNEKSKSICAEPVPIGAAYASASTEIIGLIIVGNPQEDERGIVPKTLRPCVHCRLLMKHHPLMKPHTIIVTAHPPTEKIEHVSETTYEVFTLEELLRGYGEL